MRNKWTMHLALIVVAAHSVACSLSIEQILEVQDGSELTIGILDLPPDVLPLEGGTVMNIDVSIGLFDLILGNIDGTVAVDELLIAAPPFDVLGIPALNTGEVCVVPEAGNPGGGTFDANIYAGTADFDVAINTIALIGNPVLAAALPGGGFPFPFNLQSSVPFGLGEMLGLLTGAGGFDVSQTIDESIDIDIDGPGPQPPLPAHVGGQISLSSTDAFPTSPLLDDCIALLAGP
ncbi:MAG: hypothetical protein ACQGVC_13070 [Myxococcota bacterium]